MTCLRCFLFARVSNNCLVCVTNDSSVARWGHAAECWLSGHTFRFEASELLLRALIRAQSLARNLQRRLPHCVKERMPSGSSSGSYQIVDAIDTWDLPATVGERGISHIELGVHVMDGGDGGHGLTDRVCGLRLAGLSRVGVHDIFRGRRGLHVRSENHLIQAAQQGLQHNTLSSHSAQMNHTCLLFSHFRKYVSAPTVEWRHSCRIVLFRMRST